MALSKTEKQWRNKLRKRQQARQNLKTYRACMEGTHYWECSRYAQHKHVFGWTAALCGLFQYLYHRVRGKPLYG